ncbi:hypothetical protein [Guggenheimella bovis]
MKISKDVYLESDASIFERQCALIENTIKDVEKIDRIVDPFDGSILQYYKSNNNNILVINDEEMGLIEVRSDFKLDPQSYIS